jgi:Leucine-rich repeat (LRR) protein
VDGGVLNVSKKNLSQLSTDLLGGDGASIKQLRASGNAIKSIADDFFTTMTHLEVLDLSGNKPLSTLPDSIRVSAATIRELNLALCTGFAGNLPLAIFDLVGLTSLNLAGTCTL